MVLVLLRVNLIAFISKHSFDLINVFTIIIYSSIHSFRMNNFFSKFSTVRKLFIIFVIVKITRLVDFAGTVDKITNGISLLLQIPTYNHHRLFYIFFITFRKIFLLILMVSEFVSCLKLILYFVFFHTRL